LSASEDRLRELLVRGLAGDATAYHAFLRDLSAYLRGFLRRRLTRRPDDVEDLVQETLLAVHVQRHTYDATQPVTAWVYAIARYKLVDQLRRTGREGPVEALDDESELLATSLSVLLEQLPERQRLPIIRMKIEGLTATEAARATGMSESAVKVGVHRGLKALAAMIRGES